MTALAFFCPCVPPTTTHQAKKVARRGGFYGMTDKPELVAARQFLEAVLLPHVPPAPLAGAVRLELSFTWPWLKGHSQKLRAGGRVLKTTKPDCSNLAKTIEDRLATLRFIENDANVCILGPVWKWHGDRPGIEVIIRRVDAYGAPFDIEPFTLPRPSQHGLLLEEPPS